ncbi:MAG: sulfite exporter TauE/SafE family protein [Actinomycetaceae bacterium]|nr:sulfite exporter TauE/SafE family protein [Actinomycetaceae bacterium]
MLEVAIAIIIGIGVGVIVGVLGAGGGILAVPALAYLLHQSPHAAATGSLVIVLATAAVALPGKIKRGQIRFREGVFFGSICVVGSFIGARLSAYVHGHVLMALFAAMLAIMCIVMFREGLKQRGGDEQIIEQRHSKGFAVIAIAALSTGFLTGFFGVGGGFMVVPVLTLVLAFSMREATGTSLLIMIMAAATGLVSRYGQTIDIDWPIVFGFMFGSMGGGLLGGPLSNKAKTHQLTLIFAVLLAVVAVSTGATVAYQVLYGS